MADFTRVVFVASGWRREEDEAAGVIRMIALGAAGIVECDTSAEPNMQGVPVSLNYGCEVVTCDGTCEVVELDGPNGTRRIECECKQDGIGG
jgi:hypothetical protein